MRSLKLKIKIVKKSSHGHQSLFMFSFTLLRAALLQLRAMSKSGSAFYAVKEGRVPGVYRTWSECEQQVKGFSKPSFKKFSTLEEAQSFISGVVKSSSDCGTIIKKESLCSQLNSTNAPHSQPDNTFNCTNIPHCQPRETVNNSATDPCSSLTTTATSSTRLESLESRVSQMEASMDRMLNVMEGLGSEVCLLQETVSKLEGAVFTAPGTLKRGFHTMSRDYQSGSRSKRTKSDCPFTGSKFEDEEGVPVYTDGGCIGNGTVGSKAGIGVFWDINDKRNVSERLSGRQSNNRAEIFAAVKAVQIAKERGIQNLILHTDSQFLINGITKWIKTWKKNGWKLSTGHPVINKEDFQALDSELPGISVKWVYVKGHSGDPGNEEADRLAKEGAEKELERQ